MRRRDLLAVAAGVVAWPCVAPAQQPVAVIGYVGSASADAWASRLEAFREGLHEAGFDEGRNVAIEFRWADGQLDKLPEPVDDFVRRKVSVLVTPGSAPAALATKRATETIPIVFETGADPIEAGLVTSLNHPGGNVTGVAALTYETGPKRLAILHEALPSAKLIAVLVNQRAGVVVGRQVKDLEAAAPQLGLQLLVLDASDDRTLTSAFETIRQKQAGGLLIVADPFANSRIKEIADLALGHAMEAKRLELLHEMLPGTSIGVMINPGYPAAKAQAEEVKEAVNRLGLKVTVINASTPAEMDAAFAAFNTQKVGAVLACNDPFYGSDRTQIAALASQYRLPAMSFRREFAEVGGLVSYGAQFAEGYRQTGIYAGKILAGAKPADLPVMQPTKFELVINLKTAKAIGLAISEAFLLRADEIIE